MDIEFRRLSAIDKNLIIDLMNHPLVRKQMPLLKGYFDKMDCEKFVEAKEQLWETYGYGPWGFIVDKQFVGWGGIQPENGEADLALVLHPNYWGLGKTIYGKLIRMAFDELDLPSVQVLFPPTRTRVKGLLSLGFTQDKEVMVGNERFIRFVLHRPKV